MPRQARTVSRSNIYHVMLRGINRQVIFEDDNDKKHFLRILQECRDISGFRLHAFCLMDNHVHLLIEPVNEPLETIFKRIGVRYSGWYNYKYERSGHLFQDRFKSENVESNDYYMRVLRYILQNPMKAGLEDRPGTYPWSSYLAYKKGAGSLTYTEFAKELFGSSEAVIHFVQESNDDIFMDEVISGQRMREDTAKEIMISITNCGSVPEFQALDFAVQKAYALKMYNANVPIRTISRLTGMSKTTIGRVAKAQESVMNEPEIGYDAQMDEFKPDYDPIDDSIVW